MTNLFDRILRHLKAKNRHHALLFHSASTKRTMPFLRKISATLLCQNKEGTPCQHCRACEMAFAQTHPDIKIIQPEKKLSPIKIEQIRALNEIVYLSSQLGMGHVIIIDQADKMNVATSNALLKLLEEPPKDVYFILHATHLSSLLPTLISRCQLWYLPTENHPSTSSLTLNSEEETVLASHDIITDLHTLLSSQKKSITETATKWVTYDFYTLISNFYWINYRIIMCLLHAVHEDKGIHSLLPYVRVPTLFKQIEKINILVHKMNEGIHVNQMLAIEDILALFF